jgi:hypothetical protein
MVKKEGSEGSEGSSHHQKNMPSKEDSYMGDLLLNFFSGVFFTLLFLLILRKIFGKASSK